MSLRIALVVGMLLPACLEPASQVCGNGLLCPASTICDPILGRCLTPAQLSGCAGAADGESCSYGTIDQGSCTAGVCEEVVCGNRAVQHGETCDDGNFLSGDGCSSRCDAEQPFWEALQPAASPPSRLRFAAAYDWKNAQTVHFGGSDGASFGDTWLWTGSDWELAAPETSPSPRNGHAMSWDGTQVVLFGGADGPFPEDGNTYLWDGQNWSVAGAPGPPPRSGAALAYDSHRKRTVLFGGFDAAQTLAETWEWDGATWENVTPIDSPPARLQAALAYDEVRQRMVLYGGTADGQRQRDVWEWNGTQWFERTQTTVSPAPRHLHAMTWHAGRSRVIMFGGVGVGAESEVWEWDGDRWEFVNPDGVRPTPSTYSHMVYDRLAKRTLLLGGFNPGEQMATFAFYYTSEEVEAEECLAAADADGDGLAGCDDPDCWPHCNIACPPFVSCENAPPCGDGVCNPVFESAALCPDDGC